VVSKLEETGQLDGTYVVYTTDNGFLQYRHRVAAKRAPYEEAIQLPFVVRGPGVPRSATRGQLVANTDLAPTIAAWAGTVPPDFVDGRSFDPLLSGTPPPWRKQLLIELHDSRPFEGLRTSSGKTYVEYDGGERELYDLKTDPYQLESSHASVDAALLASLQAKLDALRDCAGDSCRAAEDAPSSK
jgi:arylsulfatase A-like enzyme